VSSGGDGNGNRSERYLACIAYLDGERPQPGHVPRLLRPQHARLLELAGGKLTPVWTFDSDAGPAANRAYAAREPQPERCRLDHDGKDECLWRVRPLTTTAGALLDRTGPRRRAACSDSIPTARGSRFHIPGAGG